MTNSSFELSILQIHCFHFVLNSIVKMWHYDSMAMSYKTDTWYILDYYDPKKGISTFKGQLISKAWDHF